MGASSRLLTICSSFAGNAVHRKISNAKRNQTDLPLLTPARCVYTSGTDSIPRPLIIIVEINSNVSKCARVCVCVFSIDGLPWMDESPFKIIFPDFFIAFALIEVKSKCMIFLFFSTDSHAAIALNICHFLASGWFVASPQHDMTYTQKYKWQKSWMDCTKFIICLLLMRSSHSQTSRRGTSAQCTPPANKTTISITMTTEIPSSDAINKILIGRDWNVCPSQIII